LRLSGFQFVLLFLVQAGVAVSEDDLLVKGAFEDGIGDTVEVCAVGGLHVSGEEDLERDFNCLVAEQEDGGQFCFEAGQDAYNLRQVIIDTTRHI